MNQFFDMQRWTLLLRKHWGENRKILILSTVAIASILLIWYLLFLMMNRFLPLDEFVQNLTYFFGLYLGGCVYASLLFADLSTRPKGINFLMVPASSFEKLLCALVFGVILFFITYTLLFYIIDISMVKLANSINANKIIEYSDRSGIYKPQTVINIIKGPSDHSFADANQCYYFLLIFFAVQSAFALGSIYASKFSIIKTSIVLLLLSVFVVLLVGQVMHPLMPEGFFYENITTYRLMEAGKGDMVVQLPRWVHDTVIILFQYSFGPLLWVTAYFRLKEKQL